MGALPAVAPSLADRAIGILSVQDRPTHKAVGGGYEGAQLFSRETANWLPSMRSPDQAINLVKPLADARARDLQQNDGHINGAVAINRDSIVGARYVLNSKPDWRTLGVSEDWATNWQETVEPKFNTLADSPFAYLDAAGTDTLTGLIRLAVGGYVMSGEVLATAEWIKGKTRPCSTAIQMVAPDRLSNPNNMADTRFLRRGVVRDFYGAPIGYNIRQAYPTEFYDESAYTWKLVPAAKPWGRRQVIHLRERMNPDQTRGISDMVSVLKTMKMTKHFQEITLQNAVVNASFAAAIESELPPEVVYSQLGGDQSQGWIGEIGRYVTKLMDYAEGGSNINIDGVKIPHLFPGTKLNMKPMGTPGGVGQDFEKSLLRHVCAALGISYEEFSRDYSQTSYSSARASMLGTWRFMQSRKKTVADRLGSEIYMLVIEEWWNAGQCPIPKGKNKAWFYEPLVKEAICRASWIGASRGQIDELKETQAAVLRVASGLSTREIELARLGEDWRDIFDQLAREQGIIAAKGLVFDMSTKKPGASDPAPTDPTDTGTEKDEEPGDATS